MTLQVFERAIGGPVAASNARRAWWDEPKAWRLKAPGRGWQAKLGLRNHAAGSQKSQGTSTIWTCHIQLSLCPSPRHSLTVRGSCFLLLCDTLAVAIMAFLFSPILFTFLSLAIGAYYFPAILRSAGAPLGTYLRRSSRTRRELLLARVASEQQTYEAKRKTEKSNEDDDWEEVESSTVGSAVNGGKADRDWSGIVGFFHPFWYALAHSGTV